MPVGPIGLLVIRRTLSDGRIHGLISGLGAASADAVYGTLAAFGLTALSSLLLDNAYWLNLIGGLFLTYLGLRIFFSAPPTTDTLATSSSRGLVAAYSSTFVLTLTNPLTILTFLGIFAGLSRAGDGSVLGAVVMVLGVFAGSALWWLLLSGGVGLLRQWMTPRTLRGLNWLSGGVILAFALTILF